ncbi:response regulator [Cupriavidus basilensis]|uniref:response regulator n=1 Tax=Cupriavidus basilensis TaxID=68895 RepID=UPI0039F6A63D
MNPPLSHEPLTIFLLEDSPLIGSRLARMLRSMNEVELLASAREPRAALLAALILLPDVFILGLHTSPDSGLQMLRDLGSMRRNTKIIVLSNCSVPPMRSAYMRAGASLFFDKTMEFDRLRSALLRLASEKRAMQQMRLENAAAC